MTLSPRFQIIGSCGSVKLLLIRTDGGDDGADRAIVVPRRMFGMNLLVDQSEFDDDSGRENEWVRSGKPILRLIELTAKVIGSQASISRARSASRGSKSIATLRKSVCGWGRIHRESERARRLQRVSDVQIMRPESGKVLPRMCTGIGRYETVAPVGRRAESVVLLQRVCIILPLIPEYRAKRIQFGIVAPHQEAPVIMSASVAEMAKQGSMRLRPFFRESVCARRRRPRQY